MREPKLSDVRIDWKGTHEMRARMKKVKKVKVTINIDEDSLDALRELSEDSGVPYQKLLNRVLKDGLFRRSVAESRLDRLEKEVAKIKKKLAAA
jgi:predicted DNA binding CopG/RHH family protein